MVERGMSGNRLFLIVVAPQPLVVCNSQILAFVRQSSSGPLFPRIGGIRTVIHQRWPVQTRRGVGMGFQLAQPRQSTSA